MQDFHQLNVWRKAHALVLRIYTASDKLPASESFGLTSHLRRSAVTIPRAIAEGAGREHNHEFVLDLRKARAAAHELEYILFYAGISISSHRRFMMSFATNSSKSAR